MRNTKVPAKAPGSSMTGAGCVPHWAPGTWSVTLRGSGAANDAGNLLFLHWRWRSMIWLQVVKCKQVVKSFYNAWISSVFPRFSAWRPCLSPAFPSDHRAPSLVPTPELPQHRAAFSSGLRRQKIKVFVLLYCLTQYPARSGDGVGKDGALRAHL